MLVVLICDKKDVSKDIILDNQSKKKYVLKIGAPFLGNRRPVVLNVHHRALGLMRMSPGPTQNVSRGPRREEVG